MTQKVQMILLGAAIACLAIGLAASVAIRNDYFGRATSSKIEQGKSKFASELAEELSGVLPKKVATTTQPTGLAELTPATCAQTGGTWNECGSLCRGKPAGTVCAQVCVPQCECSVGKGCPEGYACVSEIPSGEGVCRAGEGREAQETRIVQGFKSADGVTSVVWDDLGAEEGKLSNGFSFHGTSTAFENVLSWRVVEASGRIVAKGNTYVHSPDAGIPGGFKVVGFYEVVPRTTSGTLEVYEASAKDGTPIHVARLSVTLVTETQEVTVYWGNTKKDPGMLDCSKVFPVKHKVVGGGPANSLITMNELLRGPTAWEKSQGYFTNIPEGVGLPEISISKNGETILNFTEALEQGVGGSCRTANIRAQIETTWANFGDNNGIKPIIAIDGRTEDILQP